MDTPTQPRQITEKTPAAWLNGPISPRNIIVGTLIVVLIAGLFWVLVQYRAVVFTLFAAIVFSTALRPVVEWLGNKGTPKWLAGALVMLLILVLLAGVLAMLIPLFSDQGANILRTLGNYYYQLRQILLHSPSLLITRLATFLPPQPQFLTSEITQGTADVASQLEMLATFMGGSVKALFIFISLILLTFYLTIDRDRILFTVFMLFPSDKRADARDFYESVEGKIAAYLRGLGIMCLSIGALSLIAYLIIGLPYVALLAVIAGIMEAVPLIGPFLGALPAVLVALALDPTKVVWVIVAAVVIQQLENNLLVPRVMDKSVGVSPVISLVAFVAFTSIFGIAGGLLAIPLAATLQLIVAKVIIEKRQRTAMKPSSRDKLGVVEYEAKEFVDDLQKQLRGKETTQRDESDELEEQIERIATDLAELLDHANPPPEDAEVIA